MNVCWLSIMRAYQLGVPHSSTFFSAFSFSAFFRKKSWLTSCLMVTRSEGFFCRALSKKSRASLLTYTQEGMAICSLTILISSSSLLILKGFSPTSISYIIIPNDQMSIFSSYSFPFRIQGQTYRGVPQKVVLILLPKATDHPKSHSLYTPSCNTMFSGLMSRWIILEPCSSSTAEHTCFIMPATRCSGRGSLLLSCWKSCPPMATSRMMQMCFQSSKHPYSLTMLG